MSPSQVAMVARQGWGSLPATAGVTRRAEPAPSASEWFDGLRLVGTPCSTTTTTTTGGLPAEVHDHVSDLHVVVPEAAGARGPDSR
jgi:hypothetical protein